MNNALTNAITKTLTQRGAASFELLCATLSNYTPKEIAWTLDDIGEFTPAELWVLREE